MMMQAAPIPVPVATRYTEIEKPEPLVDIEAEPGALTREVSYHSPNITELHSGISFQC